MKIVSVPIGDIKPNPNNPRIIKDDKYEKLLNSIKAFPEMLEIRPIVVNADMVVLGGNMRLKACKEAGLKKIPIIKAEDLTEEQQREFIIKDNVGYGEWDWQMIAKWDTDLIKEWGLDVPDFDSEFMDYSILDANANEDIDSKLDSMMDGVRKAIQIEFEPEHYDQANELVKFWRERDAYVGFMLIEKLKEEREKIEL